MIAFISENLANILITAVILVVVVGVLISLIKKKMNGKSVGCGCSCDGYPSAFICHKH